MKARVRIRSFGVARAPRDGGRQRSPVARRPVEALPKETGGEVIPGTRAVLAFLLVLGAGGVGLASDRVRAETGVDRAVAALGVSGEGVIVAMLDRGIDWESNDFRNSDGSTRIAWIFDMGDDSGADAPGNPYGRGTIYTREQINRALFGGTRLPTRDAQGHGTTSTGIPAGNGRNSADRKYRGVAPNATIISVKVTGGAPAHGDEPAEPYFDLDAEGYSVAMDFVVDKARELSMPVVMLLNLGSIGGPTDGTSAFCRKIDATVGPAHPGVVFVTGTGDDGIPSFTQLRSAGDVPNGGTVDLRFALDTGEADLEVWYDQNQGFAVSIDTPAGMLGPYPASQFAAMGIGVNVYHGRGGEDHYGARNGKRLLFLRFDGAAGAGEYVLRLDHTGKSAGTGIRFDASLNSYEVYLGFTGRFLNFVTPGGSIWDGATAFHNVAPNSYVIRTRWTDINGEPQGLFGEGEVGELWTGSSVGPTVDGRLGVDVSAPGDRVITTYALRSHWATFPHLLIEDGGGLYGMAGAVSAAAPIVTGIIALMLEVDPTLDALTVKKILQETARSDEFTGPTPNPLWGYGKVDAFGALIAVRRRIGPHPQFLNKLSGDEQQAAAGVQLAAPLVVSVLDQNGAAYPGAVVTFAVTSGDGTLSAESDTTDANGLASTSLTLGEPGTNTVKVTVAGLKPETFTATAKASPDFDGDGEVGFSDFLLFAEAFGGSDHRFDLDTSGSVDFADFLLFVKHFGQPARAEAGGHAPRTDQATGEFLFTN